MLHVIGIYYLPFICYASVLLIYMYSCNMRERERGKEGGSQHAKLIIRDYFCYL